MALSSDSTTDRPAASPGAVADHELTDAQRAALASEGYVVLSHLVPVSALEAARAAFSTICRPEAHPCEYRQPLLRHAAYRDLLMTPRVRAIVTSLYGDRGRLLECFWTRQEGLGRWPRRRSRDRVSHEREWHRDFSFVDPGLSAPLMVTFLMFLEDVYEVSGPTLAIPGTHRAPTLPAGLRQRDRHPAERPLPLPAGSALLIDSALLHSRGRNRSRHDRRGFITEFGFHWMSPCNAELPLPPEAVSAVDPWWRRTLGHGLPDDIHGVLVDELTR